MQDANPQRRQLAWYPITCGLQTRESDIDHQGIINNVALLGLYSEARACLCRKLLAPKDEAGEYSADVTLSVRETETIYLHRALHGSPIVIAMRILSVSPQTCHLAAAAFQQTNCVSVQDCTLAYQRDRRWAPIPAALSERLRNPLEPLELQ